MKSFSPLLLAWLAHAAVTGQSLVWRDSVVIIGLQDPAGLGVSPLRCRLDQHAAYSLAGTGFIFTNQAGKEKTDYLTLFHRLDYRLDAAAGTKVRIGWRLVHELGIRYFPDSLAEFRPDETTLTAQVDAVLFRGTSLSFTSSFATRLCADHALGPGPDGKPQRYLSAAFLSPLQGIISSGIKWAFPGFGSLDLGLSAAKLTLVCNQKVYDRFGAEEFCGVPKGRGGRFDYGLSLQVSVGRLFFRIIRWDCDLLLFKGQAEPADLTLKNDLGIRIGKYLRGSLRTRLIYEKDISPKLRAENMLSVGLYVQL